MILVNPFETPAAQNENRAPLRAALDWLAGGGLLSVFPAGEVAHLNWREQSVTDPQWKTSAARLALHTRCAVVPAFFEGSNSIPFQLAGILHPGLRTMALAREFGGMRGRTVRLRIGSPIRHGMLAGYRNAEQATAYMRSRTFFLSNRSEPAPFSPFSSPRVHFFERIGPAVELGRSFVVPEYQKNYAALLLLWKGITRAVGRADIEDLSLSIADIEDDGKGVPVLIRQYLKAGGRVLGFSVDPNFPDTLDALILVDLRDAPLGLLERCMGRLEAQAFREAGDHRQYWQGRKTSPTL